jgi:hypothetical protein
MNALISLLYSQYAKKSNKRMSEAFLYGSYGKHKKAYWPLELWPKFQSGTCST